MNGEPDGPSDSTRLRIFNPIVALRGEHSPSRVVLHGLGYLIGFPVLVIGLIASGLMRAIIGVLRNLGLSSSILSMFPILLALAYLGLWIWFLTALFRCAGNADMPQGMNFARSASRFLGIATAVVIIVVIAVRSML